MDQLGLNALRYDPHCHWVSVNSQVYFNKNFFIPTERLKVLVFNTDNYSDLTLRIYPGIDDDLIEHDSDKLMQPMVEATLKEVTLNYYSMALEIDDKLRPGSYMARVYRRPRYGDKEPEAVLSEYSFTVLEPQTYLNLWRQMFAGEWDDPIYMDELDADSTEELLLTFPADDILTLLPSGSSLDGTKLCQLLGPLTTAFMINNLGPLPFSVYYDTKINTETPPHIDLVKLFWLLNVLSFALVDVMFFSAQIVTRVDVDEQRISVYFISNDQQHSPYESDSAEPVFADFISVIEDTIKGQLKYDLDIHAPYKAGLNVYSN